MMIWWWTNPLGAQIRLHTQTSGVLAVNHFVNEWFEVWTLSIWRTVMMLYDASVSFLECRDAEEQPERHLKT